MKDGFLMYFSCFKIIVVRREKDTFSLNTFLYFLNFELNEYIVHKMLSYNRKQIFKYLFCN